MYILTDGKNYVMRNPMQPDRYISTTSSTMAEQFSYKRARSLLQKPKAYMKWVKDYQMVNVETGKSNDNAKHSKGNGGAFKGENSIKFDKRIISEIKNEKNAIIGVCGWDETQLQRYRDILEDGLSMYDSAESDVGHALQKYRKDHNGGRPPAHKMSKVGYLIDDIRITRQEIKQCLEYVKVMQKALDESYNIQNLKKELDHADYADYKARTEYWDLAEEILNDDGSKES